VGGGGDQRTDSAQLLRIIKVSSSFRLNKNEIKIRFETNNRAFRSVKNKASGENSGSGWAIINKRKEKYYIQTERKRETRRF
jgi:hypothetical protein